MGAKRKFPPRRMTVAELFEARMSKQETAAIFDFFAQAIDKAKGEAAREAYDKVCALFVVAMRSLYGFGYKRTARVMNYIEELTHDISNGETSIEEIIETLKDEGIPLR